MTTNDDTRPTFTDRTAPAPWALCEVCAKRPALTVPGQDGSMCPVCARRNILKDVAQASLEALCAPILGGWANHWQGAGLTFQDLTEALEFASGAWANHEHQHYLQRRALRYTRRTFPAPTITQAPPDRFTLDARTLPTVTASHRNTGGAWGPLAPGEPDRRLTFTVREADGIWGEPVTLGAGPDAVLMLNVTPEGDAVLYQTGLSGQLYPADYPLSLKHRALRVPDAHLPAVRATGRPGVLAGGGRVSRPRPLIPGAVSLAAVQIVPGTLTANGRPALALACYTTRARVTLAVIPSGASWALSTPAALPNGRDEREGLTLARLGGARLTVEHEGRRAVLDVPAVRLLRELCEALGTYDGHAVKLGGAA